MTRVNLLTPRLPSKESMQMRRLIGAGAAVVVALAVSVGAYLWILVEQASAARKLGTVEAELAVEERQVARWQALMTDVKEAEGRKQILSLIPPRSSNFASLVRTVTGASPAGCQVAHLVIESNGTLSLKGTADSHTLVAAYLDQLRAVPGLEGVEFQSSVQPAVGGGVTFSLTGASSTEKSGSEGGQGE